VSINGANRLGSNSLTELLVFGARAGENAVDFAIKQGAFSASLDEQYNEEVKRLNEQFLKKTGGTEKISDIRMEMQASMEKGAGIYRTEESLLNAQNKIQELKNKFKNIQISDHSSTFNTELTAALELSCLLDIAESVIQSGLHRKESRGSHQRTDFPERDDDQCLAHSLAYRKGEDIPEVRYKPVVITQWPPGERVYGR